MPAEWDEYVTDVWDIIGDRHAKIKHKVATIVT